MYLADNITKLREEMNYSLGDLSHVSGVSKGYLSELENGKRDNLSVKKAKRLSDALGVSIEELCYKPLTENKHD